MRLILPCLEYEGSYRDYITELGNEERYPFPLDFDHADFPAMLAKLEQFRMGVDLPQGFVPSTTYWLVDQQEMIGVANLRHYLNARIERAGGHIGLGVRPRERGKGLGATLLRLTLEQAWARSIQPVHVHCYKHNQASARMILANGGVLDSEIEDGGETIQRYIISPSR
ncbi:GNAT family N-acetyltransferase [Aliidiomarina halalkaliphila]|uniref:GNAT family N-acetyltransferase n=1 Tax=Aliidiomarina halalkaliphila TaxID=2593535 RepID=UPI001E49B363|nr:GNAT family N-acetyltransferase [Aliidiomarina halalkaliphila]